MFVVPKAMLSNTHTSRILSLRNPTSKMSKSEVSDLSRINIDDSSDSIVLKIKKATLDQTLGITYDPVLRPGVSNLLDILAGILDKEPTDLALEYSNLNNENFKKTVSGALIEHLYPIRVEIARLEKDPEYINQVLLKGELNARNVAEKTIERVKNVIGLPTK